MDPAGPDLPLHPIVPVKKTLKGLMPYEFLCKLWTQTPDRFTLSPIHQMQGLEQFPCHWVSREGRAAAFSLGKTPIKVDAPRYTHRKNALNSRTAVVLTGNLLPASQPAEQKLALPTRFLLFVGERSGRKGFYSLIRVLTEVFRAIPDLHLVCTGTLREDLERAAAGYHSDPK